MEALAENGADTVFSMNNAKRRKVREMVLAEVAAEAGPRRYFQPLPFHPTHFEPLFVELHGML
jgi:hypothetical protein